MIWVLLAALGVPIWLIVGGLFSALWNRRRVRRTPDAFPCKLRTLSAGDGAGNWSRGTACARWVHNVLIVNRGLALARSAALPVHDVQGSLTRPIEVKLRGGAPISIYLSLDDGSVVEVAVESPPPLCCRVRSSPSRPSRSKSLLPKASWRQRTPWRKR